MQQFENISNSNDNSTDNTTSYTFDKRIYITESILKENSCDTIDSILIRLMNSESEKH